MRATKNKEHNSPKTALIILDMINQFNFPEAKKLHDYALAVAENIEKLKRKAKMNSSDLCQ